MYDNPSTNFPPFFFFYGRAVLLGVQTLTKEEQRAHHMRLEKQRRNDWQTNSMAEQHQVGLLYLTCLLLYLRCLNAFSFVVDVRYHIDKQDMK